MSALVALTREAGMTVTVFTDAMPMGGTLLLIPPLRKTPEASFGEDVSDFLRAGGSLILMVDPESREQGNSLLEAVDSSLRFGEITVPEGATDHINADASCWDALSDRQFFRYPESCTLEPGSGQWLVMDDSGNHTLLAREYTPWGGSIFAAGGNILADAFLSETRSPWDLPEANQTLLVSLLGTASPVLEQQCIDQVRWGNAGDLYRIKGYVTAGTSNPHTTFPDTIYLQDETGGIAVTDFAVPDIPIGTSMEVIGILRAENGIPALEYADHRLTQERPYVFSPRTMPCEAATDYSARGGELVQIEGTVTALTLTSDRKGISRLTVKDVVGDTARVEIEDVIRSGSTGKNTLAEKIKKSCAVRVLGLLHVNAAGETVIRVRNCDEVVYVPPKPDPSNPRTADPFWWLP